MTNLISHLIDGVLNKNEREREEKIFYLKSSIFLILIVIFFSNKNWSMVDAIEILLGKKIIYYILIITKVGLHFYTTLAKLAFVIMFSTSIIYICMSKISQNRKLINYMNRIRLGAEFRFRWSIEDIVLCLMIAYLFDSVIISEYVNTYSEIVVGFVFVAGFFVFTFTSLRGVLNRFFVLWGITDKSNEK